MPQKLRGDAFLLYNYILAHCTENLSDGEITIEAARNLWPSRQRGNRLIAAMREHGWLSGTALQSTLHTALQCCTVPKREKILAKRASDAANKADLRQNREKEDVSHFGKSRIPSDQDLNIYTEISEISEEPETFANAKSQEQEPEPEPLVEQVISRCYASGILDGAGALRALGELTEAEFTRCNEILRRKPRSIAYLATSIKNARAGIGYTPKTTQMREVASQSILGPDSRRGVYVYPPATKIETRSQDGQLEQWGNCVAEGLASIKTNLGWSSFD